MYTFFSIRQIRRMVARGLWHTPADSAQSADKQTTDALYSGLSERSAGVWPLSDSPDLGAKLRSGRRRRRRAMGQTYVILAFGLGLGACGLPGEVPRQYPKRSVTTGYDACRGVVDGTTWANCMAGNKPRKLYPPAELLFKDWR